VIPAKAEGGFSASAKQSLSANNIAGIDDINSGAGLTQLFGQDSRTSDIIVKRCGNDGTPDIIFSNTPKSQAGLQIMLRMTSRALLYLLHPCTCNPTYKTKTNKL
jgi:hypothetical protein